MAYSYTEKKRIRKSFGKLPEVLEIPYLLTMQAESYASFLQSGVATAAKKNHGIHAAFQSVFPIVSYSGNAALEYVSYSLGRPTFDVKECQMRGQSYEVPLRVKLRLSFPSKVVGTTRLSDGIQRLMNAYDWTNKTEPFSLKRKLAQ